jgi:hypothetical protein
MALFDEEYTAVWMGLILQVKRFYLCEQESAGDTAKKNGREGKQ